MVHFVFWKRLPPHHLKIKGNSSSISCRTKTFLRSWTATERTTARHLLGHASLATVGCEAPTTTYPREFGGSCTRVQGQILPAAKVVKGLGECCMGNVM